LNHQFSQEIAEFTGESAIPMASIATCRDAINRRLAGVSDPESVVHFRNAIFKLRLWYRNGASFAFQQDLVLACSDELHRFEKPSNKESIMPRGDKSKYTEKQIRMAEHIEEGYEKRGVPEDEAESRAWATVNATDHGGKKSGSGRGKARNPSPSIKGGHKGGAAAKG
jgi:plasmid stabilization system protein ParE